MKEYTLSQQYAIVGLDGLDSSHVSTAKKAVRRAIAAAKLLEDIIREQTWAESTAFEEQLEKGLKKITKKKKNEALETEVKQLLEADGVLEEVPALIACDLNYYSAGVDIKEYRSDADEQRRIIEGVRAEILEEGPITVECVCLLWLFRESGCLHDMFSTEEQKKISERMIGICAVEAAYGIIWEKQFHSSLQNFTKSFLLSKYNLFKNPYLEGVNLLFPFLDRRQAIFVDYVILGTDVKNRRIAMLNFLTEKGHYVEEVKSGTETLLKVDNHYYRVFPKTIACYKVPIQGAQLVPVYL